MCQVSEMADGGSSTSEVPPTPNSSMNIFRKRLGLVPAGDQPAPKSAVRCLFGAVDQEASAKLCQKVQDKALWSFSRKWNFNITGKEQMPPTLESSTHPTKYDWTESYDEDYMANCDRLRFKVPESPAPRQVTLLYGPTIEKSSKVTTPSKRRSSSLCVVTYESPNSLRCVRIRTGSPARVVSAKILRQRTITDYMSTKKSLMGKEKNIQ